VAEWVDAETKHAYYEEYMGVGMENLHYYSIEVILKSYVSMD